MKLKILQIRQIYIALAALDGKEKLFGAKGEEKIIKESFKFSGKMRWNIAKNLKILDVHIKVFNEARDGLIKQIAGGLNEISPDEKEKIKEFSDAVNEIDKQEVDVDGLLLMDLEEFNLDKNDIPSTILFALNKLIKEDKLE